MAGWCDSGVQLRVGGGNQRLFDQVRAPSTIGGWLRAFKWSNVRELAAVSRELLARLWAAGAGPADPTGPLTFDLLALTTPGDIAPDWTIGIACGLGGLLGGYAGARLQPHLPERALRLLLGLLALR